MNAHDPRAEAQAIVGEGLRARVLEPFVRLDASRSRHTGGHGLGLSIAARIVRLHDGTLRVDRAELGCVKAAR